MVRAFRSAATSNQGPLQRLRVVIRGAVQGVGFRPFVYRLARNLDLTGWVNNSAQGVFAEVEGPIPALNDFLLRLELEKPPLAFIQSLEPSFLDIAGYTAFEIRASEDTGVKTALVQPDVAVCADCLREVFDPRDRRYLYPFTNCTNCGPRFTIINSLPYDRPNTSMKKFRMCSECQSEYDDPGNRRFHAQPNACPTCGPYLELWNTNGDVLALRHDALLSTAAAIRDGRIAAVKGLGGFHLMVDARNEEAIAHLRRRKYREEKPFAVMMSDIAMVMRFCQVNGLEERLLRSAESPIVLLKKLSTAALAGQHENAITSGFEEGIIPYYPNDAEGGRLQSGEALSGLVAPGNPDLGVMLPYTPLHHILVRELGFPVVATSGNATDEPICTDENEAVDRLEAIADVLLVHDRPIIRHVDDSIVRLIMGREMMVRRARGYAPLPVHLTEAAPQLLAVGAHLKNTVAASLENEAFVSQHIGDLETPEAYTAFKRVIKDFRHLYELHPELVVHDLHPAYLSTQYALNSGVKTLGVQHHYAHVLSCMAENEIDGPVLGIAWDGTGYGTDGTIWGGEFLRIPANSMPGNCACTRRAEDVAFERAAHFRTFPLPGGESAIREPRRIALGLLYQLVGESVFSMERLAPLAAFEAREIPLLKSMLRNSVNCPLTSSAGRLFDAVASIAGLRQRIAFEGQAAMMLEFALDRSAAGEAYTFHIDRTSRNSGRTSVVDWGPMIMEVLQDAAAGVPASIVSARFHNGLVESIVQIAKRVGERRVVLSGGCFQNKYLTERTITRLRQEGLSPYWHQRIPSNDGGISLGQIKGAVIHMRRE